MQVLKHLIGQIPDGPLHHLYIGNCELHCVTQCSQGQLRIPSLAPEIWIACHSQLLHTV